jgi:hypothetical protein
VELRSAALSGFRWMAAGRAAAEVIGFASTIVLARLIPPGEYGRAVVVLAFSVVTRTLFQEGLTAPLIGRKEVSPAHLRTAALAGALAGAAGALRPAAAAAGVGAPAPTQPLALTVYKDPNCGCCEQWVTHMAAAGFRPAVHDVSDLAAVKARLGVPAALHSCHTAVVGGVVVEGHVPAADVRRFLRERPRVGRAAARGLAVPGMPAGSPGMEGPPPERYVVVAFAAGGATTRFASH